MFVMEEEEQPQPKVNEFGYEEFDSSDFEAEPIPDQDEDGDDDTKETDSDETKDATSEDADPDQDGEKDDGGAPTDDDQSDGKEASGVDGEESQDGVKDQDEYQSDTTYKVYDEVKEFPEEAKALIKDKASEDYVRTLLSKADALEPMKAKQAQVVEERDSAVNEREMFKSNFQRAFGLKDQNPDLFCAEFQLSPEWILRMANKIADAKESPESWTQYQNSVRQQYDQFASQLQFENERSQFQNQFLQDHEKQMTAAISEPTVQTFASQYDTVHGSGAFRELVRQHGDLYYQRNKQNIPPGEAVKAVMQTFTGFGWNPDAQQQQQRAAATGTDGVPPAKQSPRRQRPKTIPSTGRGRNVSPTRTGPRTLKDMKAKIARELAAED